MIEIYNPETIRNLDKKAIESGKFTSIQLMENTGESIFKCLETLIDKEDKIVVACGSSNNGGDGYVVARKLFENGFNVEILKIKNPVSADCVVNYELCQNIKINDYKKRFNFNKYTHLIDCIFGTGLNRNLDEFYVDLINEINNSACYRISVDNPSGLNLSNGTIFGACVKSDLTIALVAVKQGMLQNDALDYCGEIKTVSIGIQPDENNGIFLFQDDDAKKLFPRKNRNRHKTTDGRVTLIAGSKTMFGAGYIAELGLSAVLSGAGYSTIVMPKSCLNCYNSNHPFSTLRSFKSRFGKLVFDKKGLSSVIKSSSIVAIGCGLGISKHVYKTIKYLLENFTGKIVIDADGINSLALYGKEILKNSKCEVILTPHIKEFSRLSGNSVNEVIENAIVLSKEFAKEFNVTLILKNSSTVITDGKISIISISGTPAMAKAGSGDVLCGVVAAMLTYSENTIQTCAGACYVCGKSAEIYVEKNNEYSLLPTDTVYNIKDAITEICK